MDITFFAAYLRLFTHIICQDSDQISELLENTSITSADLEKVNPKISIQGFKQLMSNARRIAQDPYIMLKVAENISLASHGVLGFALAVAPNRQAIVEIAMRFSKIRANYIKFNLVEEGDCSLIELIYDEQAVVEFGAEADELAAFHMIVIYKNLLDRKLAPPCPTEIYLKQESPSERHYIQDCIKEPIHFGCGINGFRVKTEDLKKPLPEVDLEGFNDAVKRCEELYLNAVQPQTTTEAVERVFALYPGRIWSIESVAEELAVSVRTLQRRLEKEEVIYRDVQDRFIKRIATDYLINERLSTEAAATLLGYRDEANLRRAFKRWHGCSIREYLRREGREI